MALCNKNQKMHRFSTNFVIFTMSSTCFEPFHLQEDGCMYSYGIVCSIHALPPTKLVILMHVKHTIPCLYKQQSSCRWTSGSERVGDIVKIKILV